MTIPSNLRIPFVAAEFDASRSSQGPALLSYRALLVGQKIAAGTATADTIVRASNADQVATLAGRGSQMHRMAKAWFANNKATELWLGVLGDVVAGVAATGTLTVTASGALAGTIALYISGTRLTIGVAAAAAQNDIATAIAAAITAATDLPVTATASTNVVTITARNKGTAGNDIDLRLNAQDGDALPSGVTIAEVAMASGATNPPLTALIAAMGDTWYHVIVHPYTDATSLTAIETELASRTGPTRMIDGVAITSAVGTQGVLSTLGDTRNSPHSCIVAQPGKIPLTPPAEFAAAYGAAVALSAAADPAMPFTTLSLSGVVSPAQADVFTDTERNLLLFDGIATSKVAAGGIVQIERLITTNQTNAAGSADVSYLDANTLFTLMYARYDWRARIMTKYPRHKLANDGTRVAAGQKIMTPSLMRAEAVAWFRDLESLGLFDGSAFDQFKTDLVVSRNATDANRLDVLLPPDLINQLIVTAATIQFRL